MNNFTIGNRQQFSVLTLVALFEIVNHTLILCVGDEVRRANELCRQMLDDGKLLTLPPNKELQRHQEYLRNLIAAALSA